MDAIRTPHTEVCMPLIDYQPLLLHNMLNPSSKAYLVGPCAVVVVEALAAGYGGVPLLNSPRRVTRCHPCPEYTAMV